MIPACPLRAVVHHNIILPFINHLVQYITTNRGIIFRDLYSVFIYLYIYTYIICTRRLYLQRNSFPSAAYSTLVRIMEFNNMTIQIIIIKHYTIYLTYNYVLYIYMYYIYYTWRILLYIYTRVWLRYGVRINIHNIIEPINCQDNLLMYLTKYKQTSVLVNIQFFFNV
jgi:hypothetical protein